MAVLVFSLLAVALAGATFLSVHSPRRPGADSTSPATIPDLNDGEQGNEGGIESKGALTPAAQPRIKVASAASGSAASTTAKHAIPASAILQIEIEHHFASATASVWLDDHLIYTQSLHGEKQRRAFVFRKVAGRQFDAIKVPAGKHLVRVRVHSKADSYDQSKIIANATFQGASLLRVVCGDKGEGLQLALQKDPPAF